MPYEGDNADEHLGDRYRELSSLPPGTLGYEFWSFYDRHSFAFPGQAAAVNEMFGTPHDCTHLISGYDTTPQGEILVSTFTSGMHPIYPVEGQVLPVIYSWHPRDRVQQVGRQLQGAPWMRPSSGWPGTAACRPRRRHLRPRVRPVAPRRRTVGRHSPDVRGSRPWMTPTAASSNLVRWPGSTTTPSACNGLGS